MTLGRKKTLKQKEVKEFLNQFSKEYPTVFQAFGKDRKIETLNLDDVELVFLDEKPSFVMIDGRLYPTLVFNDLLMNLPRVVVDRGAIPHICNGADVMVPGIRRVHGDFLIGAIVAVAEDSYGKFLAVGDAAERSEELRKSGNGKGVLNKHYVGDKIWKAISNIS